MTENILVVELLEIHQYVRQDLQTYVGWFTFFLTLLLGAMGWSLRASLDLQGRVSTPFPFYCMMILFTVQLIFAIIATHYVGADFLAADRRVRELQLALGAQVPLPGVSIPPESPIPQGIHIAMRLMKYTLISNLVFWWGVTVLVFMRQGKKLAGGSGD